MLATTFIFIMTNITIAVTNTIAVTDTITNPISILLRILMCLLLLAGPVVRNKPDMVPT